MSAITKTLSQLIINPLLLLLFSLGLLMFMWGLLEFLIHLNTGQDTKEGKQHMLWGVIGMFVMASAYKIVQIMFTTFNR